MCVCLPRAGHGSSIHFVHFGAPGEYPTIQVTDRILVRVEVLRIG